MQYDRWMYYAVSTLEPFPFLVVLHTSILPPARRVSEIVSWATRAYLSLLKVLNRELEQRDYLLGDSFSTADIMVGSTLLWLPELLDKYPVLERYTQRLEQRDAYQRALTDPSPNA